MPSSFAAATVRHAVAVCGTLFALHLGAAELSAQTAAPAPPPQLLASNAAGESLPDAPTLPDAAQSSSSSDAQSTTPPPPPPDTAPKAGQDQQVQADSSAHPGEAHQTKRIGGIMPNYRSVSADQTLPVQTAKQKFIAAGHDSFDYGSFILAAIQAGFAINDNSYPEFRKGIGGYWRYYWRTQLDTTDENFLVGGVLPSVFHQDARFYTLGHGSFVHRALYASTRVLITRGDSGNLQPNVSEIIGAGAASGISSTYYPAVYRTWTKVGQKWLTGVLIDSANTTFKEFWPDINKHVFHNRD